MLKWRQNMTEQELAQFKAEMDALDAAYASAAEHDSLQQTLHPVPDEWEDEGEYWRRAGLDNRGRP